MSYFTREDIPYYHALADAFTVGDNYFCSVLGPTNPNRMYMWSGCIGNLSNLGPGGADGHGAGPATANGLSANHAYWVWKTLPEVLQTAGVSWKIYQDLAGSIFAPDFGDGTSNAFAGNFGDNSLLYFNQYLNAPPGTALFDNACTGTSILDVIPESGAPDDEWVAWAGHLFDQLRTDVKNDTLPQVSWIVAPAGYTEHSDWPVDYGAWYISQVFDILVSNPKVFSKTAFIVNFDEADGSFDHIVPPCVPPAPDAGASTVSIKNEIVTTSDPNGPIGLGSRVPFLVMSPWSKGGFVNSEVFDHTSVVQFIEKRFGVTEPNISPWRRAVTGDLTSAFNFKNPNKAAVTLPDTDSLLPPPVELGGGSVETFIPTQNDVVFGVPTQEPGIRPARALPYELNVQAAVSTGHKTVTLTFTNTGAAAAVFHVRSGNVADAPRFYTVEPGKKLNGKWVVDSNYDLSVYGPNGFVRFFTGIIARDANALDIQSQYGSDHGGSIHWTITNAASGPAVVNVVDAYTGDNVTSQLLHANESVDGKLTLKKFHGWYDLVVTVSGDPVFKYRLAGHVETGRDSFTDPAMGGLVSLQG
jgi:phospholipase C